MDIHALESFALAKDRSKALDQFVPGTDDHFFHSCLLAEQAGKLEDVERLLAAWNKQHGETSQFVQMRHRLHLLRYEKKPADTLGYLESHLGLSFDHERESEVRDAKYPDRLDNARIERPAVKESGLNHSNSSDHSGFQDPAIEWLAEESLEGNRLRNFLQRVQRPDLPRLVDHVAAELKDPHSGGFGRLPIHAQLLPDQLDELLRRRPELKTHDAWVHARLAKLLPGPDVDWAHDAAQRQAHLERLWAFVRDLAPKFNALKALILWHRLEHDRRQGVYDRARFLEYLRLPRNVHYANPKFLEDFRKRHELFNLGQDFRASTLLEPVPSDEELVRDYLSQFLLDAKDTREYEPYILTPFLREVFATAKLLAGAGDPQAWIAMLGDASRAQELKDRVTLSFARTNPTYFRSDDAVALDVDVKNVKNLVVKVFEINSLNHFLAHGRDVDTAIDLDGLAAGEERTLEYDEPAFRQVRRRFDFPSLRKPGTYVVEFIGGGISSRAVVRKGRLRFVERAGSAGHAFTILDEDGKPAKDATLWMAGREYRADEDGEIRVPYTASPGPQGILLKHGDLCTLEQFDHRPEAYAFHAGLHVDREALLKKREARVFIQPVLTVNGIPAALSLVEEPVLSIRSVDRDGVAASLDVPGLELREDRETVHAFQVPENLASITFVFRGKVQSLSLNRKIELSASRTCSLNAIDATEGTEALHLERSAEGYAVHLLGKTGEPKAGVALNVTLRHRDLVPTIDETLQTDAAGRIRLGHLRDITEIVISTPRGHSETWPTGRDRVRRPSSIHVRQGEAVQIPYADSVPAGGSGVLDEHGGRAEPAEAPSRAEVSLLERVGSTWRADHFDKISLEDGALVVKGLPPGDFELRLKRETVSIEIRVVPGEDRGGWVVGPRRQLERRIPRPLHVRSVKIGKSSIQVALANAGPETRVHAFGTRYAPAYDAFDSLRGATLPPGRFVELRKAPSHYVSGRDIGDEYRYILERKYAKKFPGNLLARPGLLLNPWAVRATETATQEAQAGTAYQAVAAPAPCATMAPAAEPAQEGGASAHHPNLDFLANPAAVIENLKPDKAGVVTLPLSSLAHAGHLRVVAVDAVNTVVRDVLLPSPSTEHQDLRLRLALDADKHFTEKKQATVLDEGKDLEIADLATSRVEVFDTLARVYRLFATLSNDADLRTFAFILEWPQLAEEQKRAKYSEFACHELGFFVSRKDPGFFKKVVKPYLANKKDKTFLDRYLLEQDLSEYRKPWAFGRLNVVERILMSRRVDGEAGPVTRHVGDLDDLNPRDPERLDRLFQSAIQGGALETGDVLGIREATTEAEKGKLGALADQVAPMVFAGGGAAAKSMPMERAARVRSADYKKKDGRREKAGEDEPYAEESAFDDMDMGPGGPADRDAAIRGRMRQFYQKLDKTQEWAENNYWHRTVDATGPDLVTANPFWRDYAAHTGKEPFVSPHVAHASRNFPEMMFALAVLDVPFQAAKHKTTFEGARMTLEAGSRAVAFHKEIKAAKPSATRVPVLVSQNYFRDDDRSSYEGGEEIDKYVTGEFLVDVVYACQVVLTNPTSTTQKLDLLLQIPAGSIPAKNGFVTKGVHVELSSYATETIEYAFYFPAPGTFAHFPVHASKNEELVASAEPARLKVVRELSTVDKDSWAWLSQNGDPKDVLRWMEKNNLDRLAVPDGNGDVGLDRILWRMKDKAFFQKAVALLRARHVYHEGIWSYSVKHDDAANLREYLLHQEPFLDSCGPWLKSRLVDVDPVARGRYEHLEYAPLVNARAQRLGARRVILNDRFAQQYARLMEVLRCKGRPADEDWLAVAYYLFLQDRVDEALEAFGRVNAGNLETELQVDYLRVYAAFYQERPEEAREAARRNQDHPVDRWRNLFRLALAQLDEATGAKAKIVDDKDRDQNVARLAATEPEFDFTAEKKTVTVNYRNLSRATANYYRMDIELLFSRQPFVQQQSGQFAFIRPNKTVELKLPAGKASHSFEIPPDFHGTNVVVELVAEGRRKSQALYAHDLLVQVVEPYGQVRVGRAGTGKPLPKVYVKAYARMKGGEVKFFKDGYTDLRGVFDYTSLSTNELDYVERFSLLILSEEHGAVIREAEPPKR